MKPTTILLAVFLLVFKTSYATLPPNDLLIVGKDSIAIPAQPFTGLDSNTMGRLEHWLNYYIHEKTIFYMTGGCRRMWQLIGDKVYLVGFYEFQHNADIINGSFCDKAENGKVQAYWLSGTIWVGNGQFLRMDPFYNSIYVNEKMITLVEGKVSEEKYITNYIPVPNGIRRVDQHAVKDTLLKLLRQSNLKELSACGCLPAGYEICVNEKGKIEDISFLSYAGRGKGDTCLQLLKQKFAALQFDIIKWHGRPDYESCFLSLFYDEEKKELMLL